MGSISWLLLYGVICPWQDSLFAFSCKPKPPWNEKNSSGNPPVLTAVMLNSTFCCVHRAVCVSMVREESFCVKKISAWFHVLDTLQSSKPGVDLQQSFCAQVQPGQGPGILSAWLCHCCSAEGRSAGKHLNFQVSLQIQLVPFEFQRHKVQPEELLCDSKAGMGNPRKRQQLTVGSSVVLCSGMKEEADSGHHCFLFG